MENFEKQAILNSEQYPLLSKYLKTQKIEVESLLGFQDDIEKLFQESSSLQSIKTSFRKWFNTFNKSKNKLNSKQQKEVFELILKTISNKDSNFMIGKTNAKKEYGEEFLSSVPFFVEQQNAYKQSIKNVYYSKLVLDYFKYLKLDENKNLSLKDLFYQDYHFHYNKINIFSKNKDHFENVIKTLNPLELKDKEFFDLKNEKINKTEIKNKEDFFVCYLNGFLKQNIQKIVKEDYFNLNEQENDEKKILKALKSFHDFTKNFFKNIKALVFYENEIKLLTSKEFLLSEDLLGNVNLDKNQFEKNKLFSLLNKKEQNKFLLKIKNIQQLKVIDFGTKSLKEIKEFKLNHVQYLLTLEEFFILYLEKSLNVFLKGEIEKDLKEKIKFDFFNERAIEFLFKKDILDKKYQGNKPINIYFYTGPTNSGKTYYTLEKIKEELKKDENKKAVYLSPLRLLALEVYEKLNKDGVPCSLSTGEETIEIKDSRFTAKTIEMLDDEKYDYVIIDEYQMFEDKDRGHSWIKAILNANSKNIYLLGSPNKVEKLYHFLNSFNSFNESNVFDNKEDSININNSNLKKSENNVFRLSENSLKNISKIKFNFEFKTFKRISEINILKQKIKLEDLTTQDCLVVFSKNKVMQYASILSKMGKSVSILYGDLPIDTRRMQAEDFKNGKTEILVTTDVIGMGLNLPINRIIFEDCQKFDGETFRSLTEEEYKQIAGRAGRFENKGEVLMLDASNLSYSPYFETIVNKPSNFVKDETSNNRRRFNCFDDYDDSYSNYHQGMLYEERLYPLRQNFHVHCKVRLNDEINNPIENNEKTFDLNNLTKENLFLVDFNNDILIDYAKTFKVSLKTSIEEYEKFFNENIKSSFFNATTLNLKLNNKLIEEIVDCFNYKNLKNVIENKISLINTDLILTLCNPPIKFYSDISFVETRRILDRWKMVKTISPIGETHLEIIKSLLNKEKDKFEYLIEKIEDTISFQNSENDVECLMDEMEDLEESILDFSIYEKYFVFINWLNKHFNILDQNMLRKNRINFSVYLFRFIYFNLNLEASLNKIDFFAELKNSDSKKQLSELNDELRKLQAKINKNDIFLDKIKRNLVIGKKYKNYKPLSLDDLKAINDEMQEN